MPMKWTQEQESIFLEYRETEDNLLVSASPGSGKTKVLEEIWNLDKEKATLYLAFNKSIVTEAVEKLFKKQYSDIKTFHSLGVSLCFSKWKSKVDTNKVYKLIKTIEHTFPEKKKETYRYLLYNVISYIKSCASLNTLRQPKESLSQIRDIIDFYDLEDYEGIEKDAAHILELNNRNVKSIDFADMLTLPLLYDLNFPFYEEVLIDEAQDLNLVQREILSKLKPCRFIFVGDPRQSIYAFRGASYDSIHTIETDFNCKRLPLTISWRCAKEIVKEAQSIYPEDINFSELALEGEVRVARYDDNTGLKPFERVYTNTIARESFSADSFIVCRTFAPLVNFAHQLLRANVPCYIKGGQLAKSYISYIKKSKELYIPDFLAYAETDLGLKINKARVNHNYEVERSLSDKLETLELLCSQVDSLFCEDLILHITKLFQEGNGTTLSTIHRIKGLEAKKVFFLASDLIPHKLCKEYWELVQEDNLKYVAITRAKEELVYI